MKKKIAFLVCCVLFSISVRAVDKNTPSLNGESVAPPNQELRESANSLSTDNYLSALRIANYQLDDSFRPEKQEYRVTVDANTNINVTATLSSNSSKLNAYFNDDKSQYIMEVTAENGSTRIYTIYINYKTVEKTLVTFDSNYGQLTILDELPTTLPLGYEKSEMIYNNESIVVLKNTSMDTTLIYALNQNTDEKNYYYFKDNQVYPYIEVTYGNKIYRLAWDNNQTFENFIRQEVVFKDHKIFGFKYPEENLSRFILISLYNDQSQQNYYQYDTVDDTLQLYVAREDHSQEPLIKELESQVMMYRVVSITLVVIGLLSSGIYFVLWKKRKV